MSSFALHLPPCPANTHTNLLRCLSVSASLWSEKANIPTRYGFCWCGCFEQGIWDVCQLFNDTVAHIVVVTVTPISVSVHGVETQWSTSCIHVAPSSSVLCAAHKDKIIQSSMSRERGSDQQLDYLSAFLHKLIHFSTIWRIPPFMSTKLLGISLCCLPFAWTPLK